MVKQKLHPIHPVEVITLFWPFRTILDKSPSTAWHWNGKRQIEWPTQQRSTHLCCCYL